MYKNYIKEIAKAKGVKIKDMAKDFGITRQTLSIRINTSRSSIGSIYAIAEYLDVPFWQLFRDPLTMEAEQRNVVCPKCGNIIKIEKEKG